MHEEFDIEVPLKTQQYGALKYNNPVFENTELLL
jgi:hypothetical protein